MATVQSNQPVYTFRAIRTYQRTDNDDASVISIRAGDDGHTIGDQNGQWLSVKLRHNQAAGYVPRACTEIGKRVGDIRIIGALPNVSTVPLLLKAPMSLLDETISNLLVSMSTKSQQLVLYGAREWEMSAISAPGSQYSQLISNAIPPRTGAILQNGNWTFYRLYQLPSVDQTYTGCAIYMILYKDIGDGENAYYIGKTTRLGERWTAHKKEIEGLHANDSSHYTIARKAKNWKMIELTRPSGDLASLSSLLRVAEHIFVCLFFSWNPKVLAAPPNFIELATRYQQFVTARIFHTISADAARQVGWPINSTIRGCNWLTPLAESSKEYTV